MEILSYQMKVDDSSGVVYKGFLKPIRNNLGELQSFVYGLITVVSITDEIDCICNDEGKLMGLPYNRVITNNAGEVWDILVGNILCVRHNKAGEFTSILPEDVKTIQRCLKPIRVVGNSIMVLPNEDSLSEYRESD